MTRCYRDVQHYYGNAIKVDSGSIVVHTSSRAIAPLCLHLVERMYVLQQRVDVGLSAFESSALGSVEPAGHTMAYALPRYCLNKIPTEKLHEAIQRDLMFSVWGMFDAHVLEYAWERGYVATRVEVRQKEKTDPLLNRERPRLFYLQPLSALAEAASSVGLQSARSTVKGFYVLAVFPGSDYVYHYARMVKQSMEVMKTGCSTTLLEVRRFPFLEQNVAEWSGFGTLPIENGDLVILGHVRAYYEQLTQLDRTWFSDDSSSIHEDAMQMIKLYNKNRQSEDEPVMPWWRLFEPGGKGELFSPVPKDGASALTMDQLLEKQENLMLEVLPDVLHDLSSGKQSLSAVAGIPEKHTEEKFALAGMIGWSNYVYEILSLNNNSQAAVTEKSCAPLKRIFFLGVRYSYWGNIIYPIAKAIYSKTQYLVYAAKCGALTDAVGIHKIVMPHKFLTVLEPPTRRHCIVTEMNLSVRNFFFRQKTEESVKPPWYDDLILKSIASAGHAHKGSGYHVSVPTIVGETYVQRNSFEEFVENSGHRRVFFSKLYKSCEQQCKQSWEHAKSHKCFSRVVTATTTVAGSELPLKYQKLHHAAADAISCDRAKQHSSCPRGGVAGSESMDECFCAKELKNELRALVGQAEQSNLLAKGACIAAKYVGEVAAMQILKKFESMRIETDTLLSIDNETSWAAKAAGENDGRLSEEGQKRPMYFAAIHRTTDYVRRTHDAAIITEDDLAKAMQVLSGKREQLFSAIGCILYKLIRRQARFNFNLDSFDQEFDQNSRALLWTQPFGGKLTPVPSLGWGILGTANIASKFAKAASKSEHSRLVAIGSRNTNTSRSLQMARDFSEEFNLEDPNVHSYQGILEHDRVTAVYVPLPNDLHFEWALKAIQSGKHVLVEKPLCLLPEQVQILDQNAKKHKVHVAEGMLPMYHPQLDVIKSLLSSIGQVEKVQAHYSHPLPLHCIAFRPLEEGGGSLFALGCYTVALVQTLFGNIEPLAAVLCPDQTSGCDVSFACAGHCKPSIAVSISCSIVGKKKQGLEIFGSRGKIVVPTPFRPTTDGRADIILISENNEEQTVVVPEVDAFEAQLRSFERCARGETSSLYTLRESEKTVATLQNMIRLAIPASV